MSLMSGGNMPRAESKARRWIRKNQFLAGFLCCAVILTAERLLERLVA